MTIIFIRKNCVSRRKIMPDYTQEFTTIPYGPLGIIALPGCEELAQKIDRYLVKWRAQKQSEHKNSLSFAGYERDTYIIDASFPRFGSGEGKGSLHESVRGYDIFIVCDMFNYGVTYNMYGQTIPMSPDEHFANLKRAISAVGGKAHRITVIMPMLYEGRQHKRSSRESLDCAIALQELCNNMGVDNIITFDAHDPRVQNAIPLKGFENVQPAYQMIKALVNNVDDLHLDKEHMMVVSPDEGGMSRCIYYSTVLGLDLGMFYKRRDYSVIVNGKNPIVAHEFLGDNIDGKDIVIVDDMISSGGSMLDTARQLKEMNARRVFICTTFGLFTDGMAAFDEAYEKGWFDKVITTNLTYQIPELLSRPYYIEADMSKFLASIIDFMNHDVSMSNVLTPTEKIRTILEKYNKRESYL